MRLWANFVLCSLLLAGCSGPAADAPRSYPAKDGLKEARNQIPIPVKGTVNFHGQQDWDSVTLEATPKHTWGLLRSWTIEGGESYEDNKKFFDSKLPSTKDVQPQLQISPDGEFRGEVYRFTIKDTEFEITNKRNEVEIQETQAITEAEAKIRDQKSGKKPQ